MEPERAEARRALAAVTSRTGELLRSTPDGGVPVRGSDWTVGEVGAHLAVALAAFTSAAQGDVDALSPYIPATDDFAQRLRAVTASTLELVPERDPSALADVVAERAAGFLRATTDLSGPSALATPWYGRDARLSIATATAMLVGEQLVHGYDVATTVRRPWDIHPDEARLVVRALTSMMPLVVDPKRADGVHSSYDLRIRGGPHFVVHVDDGTVWLEPDTSSPVCCHVTADPVTFLLLAYGRTGQWGPIAKGRLLTWGRRPWRALRFKNLFYNP